MKILVFDDKEINRRAAEAQLKDHDLTVVGTYDEAEKLLYSKLDETRCYDVFEKKYGDRDVYKGHPRDEELNKREGITFELRQERIDFWNDEASKYAETIYPDFDVVLTDFFVPASQRQQRRSSRLVGQEMHVGIFIGILAAVKGRVKYIAVFTDCGHHDHPASACFDAFGGEVFSIEDSKVLLSNAPGFISNFDPNDLAVRVDISDGKPSNVSIDERREELVAEGKIVSAKNWAALLEDLISQ